MPLNYFLYANPFYNSVLATACVAYLILFFIYLVTVIVRSLRAKKYLIKMSHVITGVIATICLLKFMGLTLFVYHLFTGSVGKEFDMIPILLTEYAPKCYSPFLIYLLNCVLLFSTLQECDRKGLFDEWDGFQSNRTLLFSIMVITNCALYLVGLTSFSLDSIGLYKMFHPQATLDQNQTILISQYFWRAYLWLATGKFLSVFFTTCFLIIDLYLINYIKEHILYETGHLEAAEKLLNLHILVGSITLIVKLFSGYGYMNNRFMELVWFGDVIFLILFVYIWFATGELDPHYVEERERRMVVDEQEELQEEEEQATDFKV
ncbi:UGT76E12 [Acrasis kona]|uniref:UGT76E12 n=1 Tax=Acrasis kona TaxID=1008807 RepID=A0AAW2ZCJ6_9EUKA